MHKIPLWKSSFGFPWIIPKIWTISHHCIESTQKTFFEVSLLVPSMWTIPNLHPEYMIFIEHEKVHSNNLGPGNCPWNVTAQCNNKKPNGIFRSFFISILYYHSGQTTHGARRWWSSNSFPWHVAPKVFEIWVR